MFSIWVRPSLASKWKINAYSSSDSVVATVSPIAVAANTWARLMLPLTLEALQDYFISLNQFALGNFANTTVSATTAKKTTGAATAWDASAFSANGYTNGAAVSFLPSQTSLRFIAGLTSLPFDTNYTSIRYGWNTGGSGQAYAFFANANAAGPFTYAVTDVLAVVYDGNVVTWTQNGTVRYTTTVGPGLRLYFAFFGFDINAACNSIAFTNPNTLISDFSGMSINRIALIGDTNCATVDVGGVCYDPTGGLQFNATDPATAPQPQGYAHLCKAVSRSDHALFLGVPVWPNLRATYAAATPIKTSHAKGVFRLASEHDWTIDRAHIYGVTLKAVEAL
jgi:hypothetical protein